MTGHPIFNRFFRRTVKTLSAEGVLTTKSIGTFWGGEEVVLSRALCRYQFIPGQFSSPKAYRALLLKVQFDVPYRNAGHFVKLMEGGAGAWTWDRDQVEPYLTDQQTRIVPETSLHPGMDDHIRQVSCIDGVEGQVWRDHALIASRWWPAAPDEREWQAFLRSARATQAPTSPQPTDVSWEASPFILGPLRPWMINTAKQRILLIGLLVMLGPIIFQLTQWVGASVMTRHYRDLQMTIRQEAQPTLAARRDSLAALKQVDQQLALGDESLIIAALLQWHEALSSYEELSINRIQLSNGQIAVHVTGIDQNSRVNVVAALEAMPSWSNVNLQPSARDISIVRGDLTEHRAPLTPLQKGSQATDGPAKPDDQGS